MADQVVHGQLVGGEVSTVDFESDHGGVQVLNKDDTEWIYVRADGVDPVVEGAGSFSVPPGAQRSIPVEGDGPTVVRLRSSGAPKFEIEPQ